METFERIKNMSSLPDKHPAEGHCRVEDCMETYNRETGGRRGMCRMHYDACKKEVENKNTKMTWHDFENEWPGVSYQDRGPSLSLTTIAALELDFLNQIIQHLKNTQHSIFLLDPSRKAGVPDLMIITADGRVLFRELKTPDGTVSKSQQDVIDSLSAHGSDIDIWRPADMATGRIDEELTGNNGTLQQHDKHLPIGRRYHAVPPQA